MPTTGIKIWGAVPKDTPKAIVVGIDSDGVERELAMNADGTAVEDVITARDARNRTDELELIREGIEELAGTAE